MQKGNYCLYFALSMLLTATGGFAMGSSSTDQEIAQNTNLYLNGRAWDNQLNRPSYPSSDYEQEDYNYNNGTYQTTITIESNGNTYYNWYYDNHQADINFDGLPE